MLILSHFILLTNYSPIGCVEERRSVINWTHYAILLVKNISFLKKVRNIFFWLSGKRLVVFFVQFFRIISFTDWFLFRKIHLERNKTKCKYEFYDLNRIFFYFDKLPVVSQVGLTTEYNLLHSPIISVSVLNKWSYMQPKIGSTITIEIIFTMTNVFNTKTVQKYSCAVELFATDQLWYTRGYTKTIEPHKLFASCEN